MHPWNDGCVEASYFISSRVAASPRNGYVERLACEEEWEAKRESVGAVGLRRGAEAKCENRKDVVILHETIGPGVGCVAHNEGARLFGRHEDVRGERRIRFGLERDIDDNLPGETGRSRSEERRVGKE